MTEEKKEIGYFKEERKYLYKYSTEHDKNTDIILNLINKQQKEIEKKDKIIDEMAKSIVHNNDIDYEICENVHEQEIECEGYSRETNQCCEKCVKQYFENKVKGEYLKARNIKLKVEDKPC